MSANRAEPASVSRPYSHNTSAQLCDRFMALSVDRQDLPKDPTQGSELKRKREWNRGPVSDLFPRIPAVALERLLDLCISKGFTYNLSQARWWNARRYTSITVAHVRHTYSDYDKLLRHDGVERYEARRQTSQKVWKVLREWCPWDESNEMLERCFQATLLPRHERDPDWDPMDIDSDSESDFNDDPMDLD